MFKGKKILVAVTGSIAAYKAILLVRRLIRDGAEVKVVMTPAAKDFVSPLTLSTLSRNPVITDLFSEASWSNHVMLGRWADLMLVAPLTCNTLAKMASGCCDNMLLATYLSATCPVAVAPAMDEDMWHHPSTQANLQRLESFGNKVIPVENGELASGLTGEGRMAEPETIMQFIHDIFLATDLEGKKYWFPLDRHTSLLTPYVLSEIILQEKMGIALTEELAKRGAMVDLVLGPSAHHIVHPRVRVHKVVTAEQMYQTCVDRFAGADIAIMSAAVADYTPAKTAVEKIKKSDSALHIELIKTRDILKSLGEKKYNGQILVGFALETENEKENARNKLTNKNADLIVLNSLRDDGAGFGYDTNKITIFEKGGSEFAYELGSKQQAAKHIVDRIVNLLHA